MHSPCAALNDDRLEPPLGLLYIAGHARTHGYLVELVDLSSVQPEVLLERIPNGADAYGFSTYTVNYSLTQQLMSETRRRNPRALMLAGGPHASALPSSVLADGFDVVVTGEGERAVADVLAALARGQRPSGVVSGEAVPELDTLPFPDYGLVDFGSYTRELEGQRVVSVLSSRGCPYKCTFCNSKIMGGGSSIRFRSPENVAREIREIKRRYGVRHFRFQDDIFTINKARVAELTPMLEQLDIVYRCFARINTCTPEMAALLKRGGCAHASFGVESGSPRLLAKHAMHKGQTPRQIEWALRNAHDAGIRTRVFLIVGFPGETDETVGETIDLMKRCPWNEFSVYPLIAYPGTPLHDDAATFGITHIDRNYEDYLQIGQNFRAGFTIRTQEFDEAKVRLWRDRVIEELLADGRTWAGNAKGYK